MERFRTTFSTYTGSAGKVDPNCWRCGGTGYYWNRGGRSPIHLPPSNNGQMPGPGCDFEIDCDCQWSGWQYFKEKK